MVSPSETSSVWRKTWKKEELYEQQCIHAVLRRMWLPAGTTPLSHVQSCCSLWIATATQM